MIDANLPTRDQHHAYLLLRVLTGFDFFGHGFARISTGTHLSGFAQGMVKSMVTSPLPPSLTLAAGYGIPVVEGVIGVLLLLGIFTRYALVAALLLMVVLMFGVTMKQDWTAAGQQMVYGLILATLLFTRQPYDISWLRLFRLGV
jgi:thiosulfate dehydrogenase [quinone] large subunit